MSQYCSQCSPFKEFADVDLHALAKELKPGAAKLFDCVGCAACSIYKDQKGQLWIAKKTSGDQVEWSSTQLCDLRG